MKRLSIVVISCSTSCLLHPVVVNDLSLIHISLIMENRYSIQEIAEMVGYSDTRTLRKHFTEQFGVSPSKYMEKD